MALSPTEKGNGSDTLAKRIRAIDAFLHMHYDPKASPSAYKSIDHTKASYHIDPSAFENRSLDDVLDELGETFTETLFRFIRIKKKTEPEVYKTANITRQHFSKIRNDSHYHPKKPTVMALAVALELNLDETKDLLKTAGYALSPSSKSDMIIRYHIENNIHNLIEINYVLYHYNEKPLGPS